MKININFNFFNKYFVVVFVADFYLTKGNFCQSAIYFNSILYIIFLLFFLFILFFSGIYINNNNNITNAHNINAQLQKWKVFIFILFIFCSRINKWKKCSNSQFVLYIFTFIIGCNYNALSRDEIKKLQSFLQIKFSFSLFFILCICMTWI